MALLDGGQPAGFAVRGGQDAAGDAVGTVEVFCHLGLEVIEAVEPQGLIETLVVVSVASFHLAVMSWCSRLDELVPDAVVPAEPVQRVGSVGLSGVRELRPVVGLDGSWDVSEMLEGFQDEIKGAVAALFRICPDKALPACLVNHGVLVVPSAERVSADIALGRDILDIHLPFDTDCLRRVVLFRLIRFSYGLVLVVPHAAQEAVEADEIPGVAFIEQFAVQLIQTNAGGSANQSQDQVDFLRSVRSRMDGMRATGLVLQRFQCAVITPFPAVERPNGAMVAMRYKNHVLCALKQLQRLFFFSRHVRCVILSLRHVLHLIP